MANAEIAEILKAVALSQGAFVLGITIVIFYHYFKRVRQLNSVGWHTITVSLSYILLLAATMISIFREKYEVHDWWYWVVGIGYIAGDISLIFLFRHVLRNNK